MAQEIHPGGQQRGTGASPTEDLIETVRQEAGAAWDDTREGVRAAVKEQQQAAAAGAGDLAGALRDVAHELEGRQRTSTARVAERAADGLESLSATLRRKDLDSIVADLEGFARREPALFLGAAVAAGFLAMRFLKSSGRSGSTEAAAGEGPAEPRSAGSHLH